MTSKQMTVIFSNEGTAALGITSVTISGNFLFQSNNCGSSLAAISHCQIAVTFKPAKTGPLKGTLTIQHFNINSPHTVSLSGTGM